MRKNEESLLENHLAFLASHRGSVRRTSGIIFIESDRPEFTYAILGKGSNLTDLPSTVQTIQLPPWSETTANDLTRAGFAPTIGLSYMILGETLPEWRVRNGLTVEQAIDQTRMDFFSEVQCKGFNESNENFAHWYPWLKAANDRNLKNPSQAFYIGHLSGKPVGTALTVSEGESAGIYAVATLPDYRRQGISAMIMNQAIHEARARGARVVTLQVKQDSYVEDFYRHLGFKRVFATDIFRRNS